MPVFDPFGDFETAGYLRNVEALKDPDAIAIALHRNFLANVEVAAAYLSSIKRIEYADFLRVHGILFADFFPWAGTDRESMGLKVGLSKGGVKFALPQDVQRAVQKGLSLGNDVALIQERPGEVMGYFAYGHPFWDGNGRAMLVVHAELLYRAGFIVNWEATTKDAYLKALSEEIDDPSRRPLDAYLKQHLVRAENGLSWISQLSALSSLRGGSESTIDQTAADLGDADTLSEYEAHKSSRAVSYKTLEATRMSAARREPASTKLSEDFKPP